MLIEVALVGYSDGRAEGAAVGADGYAVGVTLEDNVGASEVGR